MSNKLWTPEELAAAIGDDKLWPVTFYKPFTDDCIAFDQAKARRELINFRAQHTSDMVDVLTDRYLFLELCDRMQYLHYEWCGEGGECRRIGRELDDGRVI